MASATHHHRNPLFDPPPQKRLTPPVIGGIAVAVLVHLGLAAYIIHERFEIKVAPQAPESIFKGEVIVLKKTPPPPPAPTPEVRQTPVKLHPPVDITPLAPEPLPVQPAPIVDGPVTTAPVTVLSGNPAPAAVPAEATGPKYVKAVWSRFPDSSALLQYYPSRAMDAEIEGSATLACTVHDTKGRVNCDVLSEAPKGYGFGDAAVRAIEARGRADTSQGMVEVGSVMRVRMGFSLQ